MGLPEGIKFKCTGCSQGVTIAPGTPENECLCPRCGDRLRFFPCFGCHGACPQGQQYCADCKTRARFGPMPLTDVDRHVIKQERIVLAEDLRRIERELRK